MKVVVAVDDSPYSERLVANVCKRQWPADTQFRLVSVVEPIGHDPDCSGQWEKHVKEIEHKRTELATATCQRFRHMIEEKLPHCSAHFDIRHGKPYGEIVDSAAEWEADRILIGATSRDVCPHFLLGSVSRAVARQAHCSVEVVRAEKELAQV